MMSTPFHGSLRACNIAIVGVTFTDADVAPVVRAQLTMGPDRAREIEGWFVANHPNTECVVVATCNRTELVLASRDQLDEIRAVGLFHDALATRADGARDLFAANAQVRVGDDAVEYLLRVSCGLESALLGDSEILGQLRTAWNASSAADHAGQMLRPVFRDAFAVGKQARSSTSISAGGAGVGSAVELAVRGRDGRVLVIGTGQAGQAVARRLSGRHGSITVANRTLKKARRLAQEVNGEAIDLASLDAALLAAEVVVCATSGSAPLLTGERLHRLLINAPEWSPLIVDLGAPPGVEAVPGLEVLTLDSLQHRTDDVADQRTAAVPAVEQLIQRTIARRQLRENSKRNHQPLSASGTHPQGANPGEVVLCKS
ncbi:MAG: NAD(P)-binding domain-containing protein [Ilumatobacteraceae bacterium]|nr:NAD(P)-binding domain-containing protein [Ilumatobacteraceae bacterium]